MDGTQVGVLEEADQVGLGCLLECSNSGALEPQVSLEVLGDLTNQPLEGELPDEKLSGLLVATDLTESNRAGPVAMGLLDTSGGWCALPGCLGGELLPWGLASSGLAGGLLRTSHCSQSEVLESKRIRFRSWSLCKSKKRCNVPCAPFFYAFQRDPP